MENPTLGDGSRGINRGDPGDNQQSTGAEDVADPTEPNYFDRIEATYFAFNQHKQDDEPTPRLAEAFTGYNPKAQGTTIGRIYFDKPNIEEVEKAEEAKAAKAKRATEEHGKHNDDSDDNNGE